jgi:hypothetical protein
VTLYHSGAREFHVNMMCIINCCTLIVASMRCAFRVKLGDDCYLLQFSLHVTVPRRSNVLSHAKHECMTTTAEETEMPAHLSAEIMREMDSNL